MNPIFKSDKTLIIAEAGVNHNGDIKLAKALIEGAQKAGADAVKFQLFQPDKLASQSTPLAAYQAENNQKLKSQVYLLNELALSRESFADLQAYSQKLGLLFLCTPFDEENAAYLHHQLHLPALKISSGEVTNLPLLRYLSSLNTPVILSTGMATLSEVVEAVDALRSVHQAPLSLLHCVSSYPAPCEAVNLRAMHTLQTHFPDCVIGYSDHTLGLEISVAAVALGARVIEKHFTLDKNLPGPDHQASLTVDELQQFVQAICNVENAMGDGQKKPHPIEQDCIRVARKSLVARYDLPKEHLLTEQDLMAKRPGTGISPALLQKIIGKRLTQAVEQDTLLQFEMLES